MAAKPRQTKNGKFELAVRHPSLPKGRKYFTFDTYEEAERYGQQWQTLVDAGLPVPTEMLEKPTPRTALGAVLRAWVNSGHASRTDQELGSLLVAELGATLLSSVSYGWAKNWVQSMKKRQLVPSTIRQRVGMVARALDHYQREHAEDMPMTGNPLRSLPAGYSAYTEHDAALAGEAKEDAVRDRRQRPGEHERILAALAGEKREGRQRPFVAEPDDALRMLYLLIRYTGCRLKEAYSVKVADVDLQLRVIRVQTSKQWRGKVKHRQVPIRPELFKELEAWLAGWKGELLLPFWDGQEPERKVTNRLSQRFASLFDYAQCEDMHEHDLRHEATCQWFELKGKDGHWLFRPEEIHRIMGWSPRSTMALRYASFRGEDLASRLWT